MNKIDGIFFNDFSGLVMGVTTHRISDMSSEGMASAGEFVIQIDGLIPARMLDDMRYGINNESWKWNINASSKAIYGEIMTSIGFSEFFYSTEISYKDIFNHNEGYRYIYAGLIVVPLAFANSKWGSQYDDYY